MRRDDFESLNERQRQRIAQGLKNEKTFVNPRNAAAGSVRQLDPKIAQGIIESLLELYERDATLSADIDGCLAYCLARFERRREACEFYLRALRHSEDFRYLDRPRLLIVF